MSKKDGQDEAIRLAMESLRGVDLIKRAEKMGFKTNAQGKIGIRAFAQDWELDCEALKLVENKTGKEPKQGDVILILHYLECDLPVEQTGRLMSYREFSGGQFYMEPFLSRTTRPVLSKFGNDVNALRNSLSKFDWEPMELGDFGAKIHAFGNLYITLVYHLGDDEFPAEAEILFDQCFKRVFKAEDAAVLASRICIGLLF